MYDVTCLGDTLCVVCNIVKNSKRMCDYCYL